MMRLARFLALLIALYGVAQAQTNNLGPGSLTGSGTVAAVWSAATLSTGSSNAQVVTTNTGNFTLQAGNAVVFVPGYTNNAATTVNVDGVGPVQINANGSAALGGALIANQAIALIYDGTYFDIPSSFGSITSSPNTWTQPQTFSGGVSLYGNVDVSSFGAKCDGVTDDTTAIQAALNAGVSTTIVFPAGHCLYTSLTLKGTGTSLVGQGRSSTYLQQTTTTGDGIYIGDTNLGDVATYNYVVAHMTIFPTVTKTGGFAVHIHNADDVFFFDMETGNDLLNAYGGGNRNYGGVWADYAGSVHMEESEIWGSADVFRINDSTDSAIHLTNLRHGTVGLRLAGGANGFHCTQSNIESNVNNMYVDNSQDSGTANGGAVFGSACFFDTSSGDNVVVNTSLGGLKNFVFDGTSIATENGAAVNIISAPNYSYFLFNNTFIGSYSGVGTGDGIKVQDSSAIVQVTGGSVVAANSGYGIHATYAGPYNNILIANDTIWSFATRGNTLGNVNYNYSQYFGGAFGAQSLTVKQVTNAVNGVEIFGSATTGYGNIYAYGSDTNIGLFLGGQGSGAVLLGNNNGTGFAMTSVGADYLQGGGGASGATIGTNAGTLGISSAGGTTNLSDATVNIGNADANYVELQGATTTNPPSILFNGTDTNVNGNIGTKGSGAIVFKTSVNSNAGSEFQINHTNNANNPLTVTGGSSGVAIVSSGAAYGVQYGSGGGNVTIAPGGSVRATFDSTGLDNTVIGGTTPAAATVTTLSVAGNVTIGGTLTLSGIPTTCSGAPSKSIAAVSGVLTQCP